MEADTEEYFDNYNMLFNHKGYKQLVEDIIDDIKRLSDISSVKDEKELYFCQGQIAAYRAVVNFEATVEAAREQAEEADVQDI